MSRDTPNCVVKPDTVPAATPVGRQSVTSGVIFMALGTDLDTLARYLITLVSPEPQSSPIRGAIVVLDGLAVTRSAGCVHGSVGRRSGDAATETPSGGEAAVEAAGMG